MKKLIKKWLGIDKMEAQLRNNDKDILGIMDVQLRLQEDYPLMERDFPPEISKPIKEKAKKPPRKRTKK